MTPLRQALREADEALTGTLLARMQDVEAARATVRLKKAAQDLLAALDASATTGRETTTACQRMIDWCDERRNAPILTTLGMMQEFARSLAAASPSPAPPEGPRDAAPAQATCEWTEDSGGYWVTTCGKLFTAGRLSESHYRFCPYCGLTLQPVVFDDAVSADGAPGGE